MKLLKGVKQPEETITVNLILRNIGRNFSELRDAHVRQLLLIELKNQKKNAPFQSIFEQLEKLNQSAIKGTEQSMLVEQNVFLALENLLGNNIIIDSYFELMNPEPLKISEVFALSYLKSYNAFNTSYESSDPNLLHEWRKRLKDVQSQFELLYDQLNSHFQKHYLKIQVLCNLLGELNDWEMMNRWIINNRQKLTDESNLISMLSEQVIKQQEALLNVARANGIKLYTFTPDQFKDHLFLQFE